VALDGLLVPELARGRHYLLAAADADEAVLEYSEENNVSERSFWLLRRFFRFSPP
jgi:hypothetical protein